MKWLKIVGLGILIWFLTFIWFELNALLISPLMFGLIVGLTLIMPAYLCGKWLGQQYYNQQNTPTYTDPTRPARAVVFARHHHSLPTRPMPAIQSLHSQPTRPMSITLYR